MPRESLLSKHSGDGKQQSVEQLALASRLSVSGVNRVSKVIKTVESPLEGESSKRDCLSCLFRLGAPGPPKTTPVPRRFLSGQM